MTIHFVKYHGAGNDFIIIDNRVPILLETQDIALLCNRRFGIGADGLILIQSGIAKNDFEIRYYNSDGFEGSLCGNGSRCAVDFAYHLGICSSKTFFLASDGIHHGEIFANKRVAVSMQTVSQITTYPDGWFLDTGSPHLVTFVTDIQNFNVLEKGKQLRHDSRFPNGTNVNFVEQFQDAIYVRTFERGVEDETLSCGTGVTAAAIVFINKTSQSDGYYTVNVNANGGNFTISFQKQQQTYSNIILEGPVQKVFIGEIDL